MHQLKSIYNSPFKDSHSHPIHTCFPMIASNELKLYLNSFTMLRFFTGQIQFEVLNTSPLKFQIFYDKNSGSKSHNQEILYSLDNYHLPMKLQESNIFSPVCHSVQGRESPCDHYPVPPQVI